MTDFLLSICIPTYNRIEMLESIVHSILSCDVENFEVLIQDNGSTDETYDYIKRIEDKRIRIFKGEYFKPQYFDLSKGKYILLLQDKDNILGNKLSGFLSALEKREVIGGYCSLNKKKDDGIEIEYYEGMDAILRHSYKCFHPSGLFYRRKDFIHFYNSDRSVYFPEYVMAEMIINNPIPAAVYRWEFINTETRENAGKRKSITYDSRSCWLYPDNYMDRIKAYLYNASSLAIEDKRKKLIFIRILNSAYDFLDNVHKYAEDTNIMNHYGIETKYFRELTSSEEINFYKTYLRHFFMTYINLDISVKMQIIDSVF